MLNLNTSNSINKIQGIHCFSTMPFRSGREVFGNRVSEIREFKLPDYSLWTMVLSALQCKKFCGNIRLYTDSLFYNYLKKLGIDFLWDEIDCSLDEFEQQYEEINHAIFWSACKFFCYSKEKTPFVCIDTDLVLTKPLSFYSDCDMLVAHYESIEVGDTSYTELGQMKIKSEYKPYDRQKETFGLNMAVCGMFNESFKREFVEEAVKVMQYTNAEYDGNYAMPELLYMEQVLPIKIARKQGYKIQPLMDCVWSPKQFRFIKDDPKYGGWIFNSLEQNSPCMHLWFHKNYIEKNKEAREEYLSQIFEFMKYNYPVEFNQIK